MGAVIRVLMNSYFLLFLIGIFTIYLLFRKPTPIVRHNNEHNKKSRKTMSLSCNNWLIDNATQLAKLESVSILTRMSSFSDLYLIFTVIM